MTGMLRRWTKRLAGFALLLCLVATGLGIPATDASAQAVGPATEQGESAQDSRAAQFKAVEGAQKESVPGGTLLIGAYAVAWLLLLLFVVRLGKLHASTVRDVERIERNLASAEDAPRKGGSGSEESKRTG